MPKIIIDNKEVQCRDGVPVLQAALEAGWDVPHYCYHPGLSIVASCRLCLMELKMPDPKTREMVWSPKLAPSCQTPVKDGMEVRFESGIVKKNQSACMEFFLLNHPLDCPVCDQAGECYLQDYSYKFGDPESRMVDQKLKNPKKDIGPKTLLYQDRCVMCSRCVRFTHEISGTHELGIVNRGSRAEIDVFPGKVLDNPMQGNVVDICPVGSLLDKDFLFKRRVWELKGADSICPGCATGCAIRIDHAEQRIYRLKPRYNPQVNQWWMCDEGRYGWKYVHDRKRVTKPMVRRGFEETHPNWEDVPEIMTFRFGEHVRDNGAESVVAVLSPFMACEEAWLLIQFVRKVAPQATLAVGPTPMEGEDQKFPVGATNGKTRFTILKEKCPNRMGIEMLISAAGGPHLEFAEFVMQSLAGKFSAGWIVGGYPKPWLDKEAAKIAEKFSLLVVQDTIENELMVGAAVVLPACAWAEREGSFVNAQGLVQAFERAIHPPEGARMDGQYLFEVAGFSGLYRGERVREMMAATHPAFAQVYVPPPVPEHAHQANDHMKDFLTSQLGVSIALSLLVILTLQGAVAYCIYFERKIAAWTQDRIGPNRAGPWGLLQPIADGIKFVFKEDAIPGHVDKPLFLLAPAVMFIVASIGFVAIPWGGAWHVGGSTFQVQVANPDVGLLYILGVASMSVYGVVLGGWASNNKYSLFGAIRATAQMLSYEIPMGLCILIVVLTTGALRLEDILAPQTEYWLGVIPKWNVLLHPIAFLILFITMLAEANRTPFDLAESEQELVGGYHTEYGALKFGMFFLAEYSHMITSSAFLSVLFLGGWHLPWFSWTQPEATHFGAVIAKMLVLSSKIAFFLFLMMWIRWTIPRFRFDQLMRLAWKGLIPITLTLLVLTVVLVYFGTPRDPLRAIGGNAAVLFCAWAWNVRPGRLLTGRPSNLPEIASAVEGRFGKAGVTA